MSGLIGIKLLINTKMLKSKINIYYFKADWCKHSSLMDLIITDIKAKYNVTVYEYFYDKNKKEYLKFGVTTLPTIIIEKDDMIIKSFCGLTKRNIIESYFYKIFLS